MAEVQQYYEQIKHGSSDFGGVEGRGFDRISSVNYHQLRTQCLALQQQGSCTVLQGHEDKKTPSLTVVFVRVIHVKRHPHAVPLEGSSSSVGVGAISRGHIVGRDDTLLVLRSVQILYISLESLICKLLITLDCKKLLIVNL